MLAGLDIWECELPKSHLSQCGEQKCPDPIKLDYLSLQAAPRSSRPQSDGKGAEEHLEDCWDRESRAGAAGIAGRGTGDLAGLSQQMSHLGIAGQELDPRENPREREEAGKVTWRRNLMDATGALHVFLTLGCLVSVPGMGTSKPLGDGQTSDKLKFVPQLGIKKFILFPNNPFPANCNIFIIL